MHFIPMTVTFCIAVLGFILKQHELFALVRRLEFTCDYKDKFVTIINELAQTRQVNMEIYNELTEKVTAMQMELGVYGIVSMTDRLMGIHDPNHQLLANFLPKIRSVTNSYLYSTSIGGERFVEEARCCDDMLIRHVGRLKDYIETLKKERLNPFRCFTEGIKFILWLPANILLWCGLITTSLCNKLKNNLILKTLTFIITVIGLLSSVITIILGWEQTVGFIYKFLGV